MQPFYKNLAGILLLRASDYFTARSCNDFDLVKEGGLTEEEAKTLRIRFTKWNGDYDDLTPEEVEKRELGDDSLMYWLAAMLRTEAVLQKEEEQGLITINGEKQTMKKVPLLEVANIIRGEVLAVCPGKDEKDVALNLAITNAIANAMLKLDASGCVVYKQEPEVNYRAGN